MTKTTHSERFVSRNCFVELPKKAEMRDVEYETEKMLCIGEEFTGNIVECVRRRYQK